MASLNQCNFIGRCGKDPETRFTAGGTAVTNISIAVSEKFKNKSGEWEEKTEWVPLVFWGKLAEIVAEYVHKGTELFVSGKFQTRQWEDKDGGKRYTTEVNCQTMQMLSGKGEGSGKNTSTMANDLPDGAGFNPDDDDIPF